MYWNCVVLKTNASNTSMGVSQKVLSDIRYFQKLIIRALSHIYPSTLGSFVLVSLFKDNIASLMLLVCTYHR